ncbi:hypothetical protein C8J57DRAFT_1218830 [Mycena rebaudengoi]|nr:hypothetical protein C8J57DRAFT_1218830 [Mycena rebaudengoi]
MPASPSSVVLGLAWVECMFSKTMFLAASFQCRALSHVPFIYEEEHFNPTKLASDELFRRDNYAWLKVVDICCDLDPCRAGKPPGWAVEERKEAILSGVRVQSGAVLDGIRILDGLPVVFKPKEPNPD